VETSLNQKISNIDSYKPVENASVTFKFNHADLSDEAKASLDQLAGKVKDFAPGAKIAHLDIDASEIGKVKAVDWAHVANAKRGLAELLAYGKGIKMNFAKWREHLAKLKERQFVEVTPDNFDDVLASMKPHLQFSVENKLSEDANAGKLGVDLNFRSLDDFSPEAVARQVKPLKELLDLRTKLADLRGTLQGNDKLEEILQATLGDEAKMKRLKDEMGGQGGVS